MANKEEWRPENPYNHKTTVVHDETKCITPYSGAVCAMDYCLKINHWDGCPCNSVKCTDDCPACAWNKCEIAMLEALRKENPHGYLQGMDIYPLFPLKGSKLSVHMQTDNDSAKEFCRAYASGSNGTLVFISDNKQEDIPR